MDDSRLCMRCFEPLQPDARACEDCGWHPGSAGERDGELAPGSELRERYRIGRVLGRGGFGITYLGWDTRLRRKRAIKEYFPRGVATRGKDSTRISVVSGQTALLSDGIEKFLTEAQLLARFENHPCIVSPRDFFEENGTAYLVMECLVGETLAHYVERNGGRILYEHALHFLEPVIRALSTLHAAGILHRDVSPENIFLTVDQQPKLLDFGAARQRAPDQIRDMTVILRENYAPPEQYTKAGRQGPWTDVYALGATLYRAVTGEHPPRSVDRLMDDAIRPPSASGVEIPRECERALMAALELRPEDRPDIDTLLDGLCAAPEPARRDALGEPGALRIALARTGGAITGARQRAQRGFALLRPHMLRATLLGGVIASGILGGYLLWERVRTRPSVPAEVVATRTPEEIESHAAQPRVEIPPAADPTLPPIADRTLVPALDPAAADPTGASDPVANSTPADAPQTGPVPEVPALPPAKPASEPAPVQVAAAAVTEQAAQLIVRSNVKGDVVDIDGSERGPSGPAGFALEKGRHKLRVRKDGHLPFETEIELEPGQRLVVSARLEPDKANAERLSRDGLRLLASAPSEWPEGLKRLQSAADLGSVAAQGALGELYAYGDFAKSPSPVVPPDDVRALAWHRKAAEQGERAAQSRLARRLEDGRWPPRGEPGTPQVGAQPKSFWDRITGRKPAPFLTVLRENKREGAPADYAEAFRWHKSAAMRGHTGSQKRLAFMYSAGRGTERNEFTALYWFLEAARQGDAEAQFIAGMCYAVGEGYSKSDEAAQCWLRRAAAQGYAQAREELVRTGFDPEANGGWENSPKACNFRGP